MGHNFLCMLSSKNKQKTLIFFQLFSTTRPAAHLDGSVENIFFIVATVCVVACIPCLDG